LSALLSSTIGTCIANSSVGKIIPTHCFIASSTVRIPPISLSHRGSPVGWIRCNLWKSTDPLGLMKTGVIENGFVRLHYFLEKESALQLDFLFSA
jgi:hypothetical protein